MVVAAQDEGEVHLPARALVLRLVQVAKRYDQVAPLLLLQLLLEDPHGLPRILDLGSAEGTGFVQGRGVREDTDHSDPAPVGAVRRDDVDYLGFNLTARVLEGLVGRHVGVDPAALKLPLPPQDIGVPDVVLMVAPCQVVDGRGIQHAHHASAVVQGRQQVGCQKISGEHADGLVATPPARQLRSLLLDQGPEVRKVVEHVHIRDVYYPQRARRGRQGGHVAATAASARGKRGRPQEPGEASVADADAAAAAGLRGGSRAHGA
mmetsp:Transcript_177820/g.570264  ORF Transcript_177820/g.570264 Transcript_177820/m.570264 type:complete len:263 (-) Transcript_177820:107-895(-)